MMTKEKGKAPSKNEDSDLISMMGMAMLDNGGLQTLETTLAQSKDPVQVISHFMAQLIGQQAEYTAQNFNIDPGLYVQPGGFLDQIVDYVERKLKLPANMSDQVYGETLEVMKAAAADPEQAAQAQGQPPAGPAPAGPIGGSMGGPMPLDQGVM